MATSGRPAWESKKVREVAHLFKYEDLCSDPQHIYEKPGVVSGSQRLTGWSGLVEKGETLPKKKWGRGQISREREIEASHGSL